MKHKVAIGYAIGHDELVKEVRYGLENDWTLQGMSESLTRDRMGPDRIEYTVVWSRPMTPSEAAAEESTQ